MKIKKPLCYIVVTAILTSVFVSILFLKTNIKDTIEDLFCTKEVACVIYMEGVPSLWHPTSLNMNRTYGIDSDGNVVYNENVWDTRFPIKATYNKNNVKMFFDVLESVDPIYDSEESGLVNYSDIKSKNSVVITYKNKDKSTLKTITLTDEDFNKVINEANNLIIPILPDREGT